MLHSETRNSESDKAVLLSGNAYTNVEDTVTNLSVSSSKATRNAGSLLNKTSDGLPWDTLPLSQILCNSLEKHPFTPLPMPNVPMLRRRFEKTKTSNQGKVKKPIHGNQDTIAQVSSLLEHLPSCLPVYTRLEVMQHTTPESLWIIIDGFVYDVTKWIHSHPGGELALLHVAGRDATAQMRAFHPNYVFETKLPMFLIGAVDPLSTLEDQQTNNVPTASSNRMNSTQDVLASLCSAKLSLSKDALDMLSNRAHSLGDAQHTPDQALGELTAPEVAYLHLEKFLQDSGLYETNYSFYYAKTMVIIVTGIAAVATQYISYNIYTRDDFWVDSFFSRPVLSFVFTILSTLLTAFTWHQLAFIAHDAGHNGITHDVSSDHIIGLITGNLLTGISAGWWKHNHNVHHIVTNHPEHDPDIQHMPFIAITTRFFEQVWSTYYRRQIKLDNMAKYFLKIQHFLYFPLLLFGRFNLYANSIRHLLFSPPPCIPSNDMKDKSSPSSQDEKVPLISDSLHKYNQSSIYVYRHNWEIACLIGYWMWYLTFLGLTPTWKQRIFHILVSHATTFILHIQITLSHFSMSTNESKDFDADTQRETVSGAHLSPNGFPEHCTSLEPFPQRQLRTTMDIDCPTWLDWFHGGLQFQVEHHLFPRIPRHNLRRVRGLVEAYCQLTGYTYRSMEFVPANMEVLETLKEVARHAANL